MKISAAHARNGRKTGFSASELIAQPGSQSIVKPA
jgi:hypothetical protein